MSEETPIAIPQLVWRSGSAARIAFTVGGLGAVWAHDDGAVWGRPARWPRTGRPVGSAVDRGAKGAARFAETDRVKGALFLNEVGLRDHS